jgi:hypothetical protein
MLVHPLSLQDKLSFCLMWILVCSWFPCCYVPRPPQNPIWWGCLLEGEAA